jgi:hypothetical protein
MAAQTTNAVYKQLNIPQNAPNLLSSLPNPLSLDLLQIFGQGGNCLVRVSSTGVVSTNSTSFTSECLHERFFSRLSSTASIANIMNDTFDNQTPAPTNSGNADIMQVRSADGQVGIWHLDYTGTAFSS